MKNLAEHRIFVTSDGSTQRIQLPPSMDGMRDLIVFIKPNVQMLEEPVNKLDLFISGNSTGEVDVMIYRTLIPRMYYSIDNNKELMYYMTFDHTPLDKKCSGCLTYPREPNTIDIHLDLLPGQYEVIIMARCFNIIKVTAGMARLKWE